MTQGQDHYLVLVTPVDQAILGYRHFPNGRPPDFWYHPSHVGEGLQRAGLAEHLFEPATRRRRPLGGDRSKRLHNLVTRDL